MKPHHFFKTAYHQIAFATALLIAACLNVPGQAWTQYDQGTPPQHAAGVSPVGSYMSSDLGTVNLGNGALNLSLPMGTVGGRGFSIPLSLNYSSKVWSIAHDEAYDPQRDMYLNKAFAQYGTEESYVDIYQRLAVGWTIGGVPLLKRTGVALQPCSQGYYVYNLLKLTVVLPDKGEIELRDDQTDGAPIYTGCSANAVNYRGERWHATDGSGIVFISDNYNGVVNGDAAGTLITPDGRRYKFQNPGPLNGLGAAFGRCASITDRNGNRISINHYNDPNNVNHVVTEYTDQLGRLVKVEENVPDPANSSITLPLLVTLKGYQGTPQYYKVKTGQLKDLIRADLNYNQQPIVTGYNDSYDQCYGGDPPPAYNYLFPGSYCEFQERIDLQTQVKEVVLPDGRSLQFKYNLYGEVAEVVLPTGGKMQYDYSGFTTNLPAGNTLPMEYQGQMNSVTNIDRAVVQRRTYPDGSTLEGTFTYGFGPQLLNGISYGCAETKVYAGTTSGTLLSSQRHFFLPHGRYLTGAVGSVSGTGYSLWSTGVEWRTEVRDGAGNVLSATEQNWNQRTGVVWTTGYTQQQPANDNRVSQTRRYLDDGTFAKTDTLYDNVNYPGANNVTEVREYDFDLSFKRLTKTTYVTGAYHTDPVHLLNLVQQQSVFSDSNATNEVARTVNEYDVYVGGDGNHEPLQDYGVVVGHDSTYDINKITRGNVTASGRWLKPNNTTIYSYLRYDTLGNPVSNKDAKGNITTLVYADNFGDGSNPSAGAGGNFGATYALPTSIISPPPTPGAPVHTAYTQYDFWSGLLTGFKDRNGVTTQTIYNDPFGRPTLVKSALGTTAESRAVMYYAPGTAFGITLSNSDVLTAKDQTTLNDAVLRSWTHTDGFGRTVETWTRDPQGDNKVSAVYDALGRVRQQSNPFRPSLGESAIYTTTVFDLAGRAASVTTPDSAAINTYYSGSRTLVKDQMGKQRLARTNALGQVTEVWEITGADDATEGVSFPNHSEVTAGYRTNYSYDTLGNLINVTQRKGTSGTTQTRTFVYNSLSQLTDATNPESGHVIYDYDVNGNLWHKTDARSITITYGYDALNRNTSVNYSNTTIGSPDVADITRNYDGAEKGIGRLWESYAGGNESDGSTVQHTKIQSYDAFGRPLILRQRFKSNNAWNQNVYETSRSYNLAGGVSSQSYPSGRTVSYAYDTAGRTNSFTGNLGEGGAPRSYATEITYSPLGGVSKEKFGTDSALYNKLFYNSRGQLAEIRVGTYHATDNTWWNRGAIINFYGTCWGMCGGHNSTASMTDNNGNLKRQEVYVPDDDQITSSTMWAQQFDYDMLNRLQRVHEYTGDPARDWQQEYVYDRWGNRTLHQTNTWGPAIGPAINKKEFTVNPNNNQLGVPGGQSGAMGYDNAGNLTTDTYSGSAVTRVYDAENRMTSETQAGNFVAGNYSYNADGQRVRRTASGVETWQIYGLDGELVAEYAAGAPYASPQKEYGYRNGQLLITAEGSSSRTNFARASNGGTVTAQNYTQDGVYPGYHFYPSYAVDGQRYGHLIAGGTDMHGYWRDEHGLPSWLQVDFNGGKTIDEVDVFTAADYPAFLTQADPSSTMTFSSYGLTAFTVEYWNGSAWTAVPNGTISGNNLVWRKITFSPITTTKIRVVANSAVDGVARVLEVEAWGPATASPTNVAIASSGASVIASSTYGSPHLESTAINGDRRGLSYAFWNDATVGTFPDWLQVNFNGSKSISEIDVFSIQDNYHSPSEPTEAMTFSLHGLTSFQAQYWDGSAWVTVSGGNVTGNNKVWKKITFSPITTDKIRVLVNAAVDGYSRITEVEAWGTAPGSSTSFVTGKTLTGLRSDYTGHVGFKMTTASQPVTVTSLGRIYVSGNNGTHTLKLVRASDNAVMASVTLNMAGGVSGQFKYASLASPVTLAANTTYYVLSTETAGGDSWYDCGNVLTSTPVATINAGVYGDGTNWGLCGGGGQSYVPVDFQYTTAAQADIRWLVTDQLGTPRMVFDKTGSLASTSRHDYLPFGEELGAGTGSRTAARGYTGDAIRQKFTLYESDNETGLDYANARYYFNKQGRFESTDPIHFQSIMTIDPQRFNLYAYARNNPMKYVDSTGERLHLRGTAINVMYQMAGGQEAFDRYFVVINGEVLPQPGVSFEGAGQGIAQLLELVNSAENYLVYQGTSGEEVAGLFQGTTNNEGRLNDHGRAQARIFNGGGNRLTAVGTLVGTLGRDGTLQPAALASGDPVFAVIAINTNVRMVQDAVNADYLEDRGHRLAPIAEDEQIAGLGQQVQAVSFVIHETAENLVFAQQRRSGQQYNYDAAHSAAMRREGLVRRDLSITGGFSGGAVTTTMPRRE